MDDFNYGDLGEFDLMKLESEEIPKEWYISRSNNQYQLTNEEIVPYSPEMLYLLISKESKQTNDSKNEENNNIIEVSDENEQKDKIKITKK